MLFLCTVSSKIYYGELLHTIIVCEVFKWILFLITCYFWGYFMFARKCVCCLRMAWVQKSILCWKGFKGNETFNKKTNKFGFTIEEMIDHKTNALYVPIWFHRLCKREESIQTQKTKLLKLSFKAKKNIIFETN